jgi:hypothetical protein
MKILPEDLMKTVIAADAIRRQRLGESRLRHARWKRTWIEPIFNAIGWSVGQIVAMLPNSLRRPVILRINQALGGRSTSPSEHLRQRQQETVALIRKLKEATGREPGVMILTSHPPTVGSLEWLRFEVVRQGLMLGDAIVEANRPGHAYSPNPQCFLAIDPYALDTVPTAVAGLYSGFMHRIFLVWDRMSKTQSWIQRYLLLRRTGYPFILWRLLKRLKNGVPVIMVLPGGLPQNARLLYAAREFVQRLPVQHWPYSKRQAQKKWMDALSRPVGNVLPCETGTLPELTKAQLHALFSEWGVPITDQPHWLDLFFEEFQLDAPYRARLFRILFNRLADRGIPFLWIAIAHGQEQDPLRISTPWAVYKDTQGHLQLLKGTASSPAEVSAPEQVAIDFAREFIV